MGFPTIAGNWPNARRTDKSIEPLHYITFKFFALTNCSICSIGIDAAGDASIVRGFDPVCRNKLLESVRHYRSKVSEYRIDFFMDEQIIIIHEKINPNFPKISLTNCIEYVINEIAHQYNLSKDTWSFIEHYERGGAFGEYAEYDLVDLSGDGILWRYLWHSDAKNENEPFSTPLLIDRVNKYRMAIIH